MVLQTVVASCSMSIYLTTVQIATKTRLLPVDDLLLQRTTLGRRLPVTKNLLLQRSGLRQRLVEIDRSMIGSESVGLVTIMSVVVSRLVVVTVSLLIIAIVVAIIPAVVPPPVVIKPRRHAAVEIRTIA